MNTQEEGVVTILHEEVLHAIIYRDAKTGHKLLFKCIPMDEEEISDLVSGKVDKKIKNG